MRASGPGAHPRYATKDHIVPRRDGGTKIVLACRECNQDKHHLSLNEWRLVLSWRTRRIVLFNFERVAMRLIAQLALFHAACWIPALGL